MLASAVRQYVVARENVLVLRDPVADAVEIRTAHVFLLKHEDLVPDLPAFGFERGACRPERRAVEGPGDAAGSALAVFAGGVVGEDRPCVQGNVLLLLAARDRDAEGKLDVIVVVVAENEFILGVLEREGFRVAREQDLDRLARLALRGRKLGDPFGFRVETPLEVCGDLDGPPLGLHRRLLPRNGERRLSGIDRLLFVGHLAEAAFRALVEVELALDGAARHGGDHLTFAAHRHRDVDAAVRVVFLDIRDADDDLVVAGLAAYRVGRHAVVIEPEPFAGLRAVDAHRPCLVGRDGNRAGAADFDSERRLGREVRFRQLLSLVVVVGA